MVEAVCALSAPVETGFPDPSDLFISDSTVVRRDGARVQSDVSSAGRLLHSLLSTAGSTPVPLRLFVTQASAQGTYANIAAFAQALAYFGKPGRPELIRALYLRCATAATSIPATVRHADPKPEVPTPAGTAACVEAADTPTLGGRDACRGRPVSGWPLDLVDEIQLCWRRDVAVVGGPGA